MATLELPYEKVYDLLHKCCTSISPDVLYLMKRAAAKETNPEAKTFLETMLKTMDTVQPSGTLVQLPSRRHLRLASTSMPAEPMF